MTGKTVSFNLTNDEALVLFEFLARVNETDNSLLFEDESEKILLCSLEKKLENILEEPFSGNYATTLNEARKKVREEH